MRSPVFVVCQGRTGGTMFSDILARLPNTRYLLEPMNPRLLRHAQNQVQRTPEALGHFNIQDYPNRGYGAYPFRELVEHYGTQHSTDATIRKWLRYLVDSAHASQKVPVFKVCRLFGRLRLLRDEFPDAAIIHLWRDLASQHTSYQRVGFPGDYFGDCSGYGLAPREYRAAWMHAQKEAQELADVSISYQLLCSVPRSTLRYVLKDGMGVSPREANQWSLELAPYIRRSA